MIIIGIRWKASNRFYFVLTPSTAENIQLIYRQWSITVPKITTKTVIRHIPSIGSTNSSLIRTFNLSKYNFITRISNADCVSTYRPYSIIFNFLSRYNGTPSICTLRVLKFQITRKWHFISLKCRAVDNFQLVIRARKPMTICYWNTTELRILRWWFVKRTRIVNRNTEANILPYSRVTDIRRTCSVHVHPTICNYPWPESSSNIRY